MGLESSLIGALNPDTHAFHCDFAGTKWLSLAGDAPGGLQLATVKEVPVMRGYRGAGPTGLKTVGITVLIGWSAALGTLPLPHLKDGASSRM